MSIKAKAKHRRLARIERLRKEYRRRQVMGTTRNRGWVLVLLPPTS